MRWLLGCGTENMDNKTPLQIARETLMQLMQRKLPPTPDNFRSVYDDIAGTKSVDSTVQIGLVLKKALYGENDQKPKSSAAVAAITPLIENQEWSKLELLLTKLLLSSGSVAADEVDWSQLIRNLLKQMEVNHKGVTLSRKKDGLSKVLINFGANAAVLGQKIQSLINSWGTASLEQDLVTDHLPATSNTAVANDGSKIKLSAANPWRVMMLRTFELAVIPQLQTGAESEKKALALLKKMQEADSDQALVKVAEALKPLLLTVEIQRDLQQRIDQSLLQLLRMMVASMSELVAEDEWFHGQTLIISEIVSKPLNIDMLYDAESSLKELTYKQIQLKPALTEAKDTLKKMVATFVNRLSEMTESTGDYHVKIDNYLTQIASTEDIGELNLLLNNVLEDTRAIGLSVQRTRDEFSLSQQKTEEAEKRILQLTTELGLIGEVAHQDYLTGALNRRGMDEALEREFSRADRYGANLCIAIMDIDHFKKINDNLGHTTGDEALVYFVKVIKEVLRTTDVVARYGGEEFIIILPATPEDEAVAVITRVQRALTKNFFMHNNERVLITFSAGVAQRQLGEMPADMIPRADAALYIAKQNGRNQVIAATLA
jgi:diguanylate cyclase